MGPNLSQSQIDDIVGTPHGQRPDPSTYMSQAEIDAHLDRFDDGAVRFTTRENLETYGTAGGTDAFVMPKSEFDQIVSDAGGNMRVVEQRLGLDTGALSNGDSVALYVPRQNLNGIRVPSGNEGGANSQWLA
jgi:filamentous hemagglutinin